MRKLISDKLYKKLQKLVEEVLCGDKYPEHPYCKEKLSRIYARPNTWDAFAFVIGMLDPIRRDYVINMLSKEEMQELTAALLEVGWPYSLVVSLQKGYIGPEQYKSRFGIKNRNKIIKKVK